MKIVSWNVNGLRASVSQYEGKKLKNLLESLNSDLICFQETKATREQLDSSLYLVDGYKAFFSFCRIRKGYSGVVTFCRNSVAPVRAEEGLAGHLPSSSKPDVVGCYGNTGDLTDEELTSLDDEGRAILTEHCIHIKVGGASSEVPEEVEKRLVVINVYCPMYDPARDKDGGGVSRLTVKTNFYSLLESRVTALERAGKLVVVVGDLNCCRETMDSAYALDDPDHTKDKDKVSVDWLSRFIVSEPPASSSSEPHPLDPTSSSTCLVDTFRYLHRTQEQAYTCWSTLLDCRKTNFGTRIDYILCSTRLAPHVVQAEVWQHVMGSDHCPVFAELNLHLSRPSSQPLPSLCSDFFTSKQSSLFSFMKPRPKETAGEGTSETGSSPKEASSAGKGTKRPQPSSSASPPVKQAKYAVQQTLSSSSSGGNSITGAAPKQSGLNESWKAIFKAKPKAPPPLCKGHNEVCVLRKVKKAGPNKDREFWVCARPVGGKNDPQARCDYFQWANKVK